MNRIAVVKAALVAVGGTTYLEIGVKDGECFHAIDVPTKLAVDPRFAFRQPIGARARRAFGRRIGELYFEESSDVFFRRRAHRYAPFDVVFVDGLHTYEQSYRDVDASLGALARGGLVIVHDCNPTSEAAAAPTLAEAATTRGYTGEWNGDVFKTIVRLRTRSDVRAAVLDCDQGVGVVSRRPCEAPLALSPNAIERLTYDDLEADREALLGLRPSHDLAEVLDAARG